MTESTLSNGVCTSLCFKKVSHKMTEILYQVAKMNPAYIALRKETLKNDYLPSLTAMQAREAFLVMIGEKTIDGVSSRAAACYNSMIANANK